MMMGVMMMPMKRDILQIRRIKILTIRITNIEMMIETHNTLEEIVKKEKCSKKGSNSSILSKSN